MRLNLETVILDADFNPIKDGEKLVNVRTILRRALLSDQADKKPSEEEKHKRFMLACKVHEAQIGEDFAAHEIKEMLAAAHALYGTLVYGQVSRVLSRDDAPLLDLVPAQGGGTAGVGGGGGRSAYANGGAGGGF
jgi:hypothetical protein